MQMYDLFMSLRFERDRAKNLGVWSKLCRLAERFRDRDQYERAGRHSWRDVQEALADIGHLDSITLEKRIRQ